MPAIALLTLIVNKRYCLLNNMYQRPCCWEGNRGLFQRLSGFETGHLAAAGPRLHSIWVFPTSKTLLFVSVIMVMDCSDCDASGLDSPNSSWSIARLKEYLRRKKRPSKRGKKAELLERDYLHRLRHLDSLNLSLFFFFFISVLLAPFVVCQATQCSRFAYGESC